MAGELPFDYTIPITEVDIEEWTNRNSAVGAYGDTEGNLVWLNENEARNNLNNFVAIIKEIFKELPTIKPPKKVEQKPINIKGIFNTDGEYIIMTIIDPEKGSTDTQKGKKWTGIHIELESMVNNNKREYELRIDPENLHITESRSDRAKDLIITGFQKDDKSRSGGTKKWPQDGFSRIGTNDKTKFSSVKEFKKFKKKLEEFWVKHYDYLTGDVEYTRKPIQKGLFDQLPD